MYAIIISFQIFYIKEMIILDFNIEYLIILYFFCRNFLLFYKNKLVDIEIERKRLWTRDG